MPYRWELLPQLALHVEHGRAGQAATDLDALLDAIHAGVEGDVGLLTLRCAQVMSTCMRGALRGGGQSERLLAEHLAALKGLRRLKTAAGVRRHLQAYIGRLAEQARPASQTRIERVVLGMVAHMGETLSTPRSLAGYARQHRLSAGHLSRSFRRIVGVSFRHELRRQREEAVRGLLVGTQMPLAEVARRIGLGSASQFIADFKARNGVTPAGYRRRHSRCGDG
jgi:two-component system response regulator YesN